MARRAASADRFGDAGLPSHDEEHWRYSRIKDLDLDRYSIGGTTASTDLDLDRFGPLAASVTLVDGALVSASDVPAGVTVGLLADHPEGEALFDSIAQDGPDSLSLLNAGFTSAPILIDVAPGTVVDAPILVAHQVDRAGGASFPRLHVRIGADAECTIIDWSTGGADDALVVGMVELDVADAARLRYLSVQELGPATWSITNQVSNVGASATLYTASVGLGGHYARQRTDCRMVGRGGSAELTSVYFGDGDQMLDYRTFQDHRAPDTTSTLLFKGAVAGESSSVYTGLIRVEKEAVRTRAFQTNRNIKLSEQAWAYSVPNLEIETNDVHCSHASAVGDIDPDQRFYLESRGVPRREAERLIVKGFFRDVLGKIPVPAAVSGIEAAVLARLDQVTI